MMSKKPLKRSEEELQKLAGGAYVNSWRGMTVMLPTYDQAIRRHNLPKSLLTTSMSGMEQEHSAALARKKKQSAT